jgi:hypothetical protein
MSAFSSTRTTGLRMSPLSPSLDKLTISLDTNSIHSRHLLLSPPPTSLDSIDPMARFLAGWSYDLYFLE